MKKRKDFLKELPEILKKSEKEIKASVRGTLKEIADSEEKEFLKEMIGKFLVLERNHINCYYGEIKIVTSKLSLDAERYNTKYRLKVNVEKEGKKQEVYLNPIKGNYKLFESENDAKKYIEYKRSK